VRQATHDVDEQRVNNIERALQKIDDGTYGYSDESGDPIPKARLEAAPESVLTVQEEQARERR
jgi:DnaK suppressor protein